MNQKIKAGPLTLALGLVITGLGMLVYNFGGLSSPQNLWKFWPLLLIGLGVEFFIRRLLHKEQEVVFHIPSAFLIGLLIFAGLIINALPALGLNQLLEETVFSNRLAYTRQWQSEPVAMAAGSRLRVENKNGTLQIRRSDDGNLRARAEIIAYGPTEEKARLDAESREVVIEKGNTTRIFTRSNEPSRNHNGNLNLIVEVPPGLILEVENSNGEVEVENVAGQVNVRTANGSVDVQGLDGSLDVRGENGQITTRDSSGEIKAITRNGSIRMENPKGNVSAETTNGEIELTSNKPLDKTYILHSAMGKLSLNLPRESDLDIEARTNQGSISGMGGDLDSGSGMSKTERLKLGTGKGSARLTTGQGHIEINAY